MNVWNLFYEYKGISIHNGTFASLDGVIAYIMKMIIAPPPKLTITQEDGQYFISGDTLERTYRVTYNNVVQ